MTDPNPESVLDSIKKVLGFTPDFTDFDLDIVMHTNSAFMTLQQMGVGPSTGFVIIDNTLTWNDFSSSMTLLANVKTFIFLNVRLVFDPPATSFVIDSMTNTIRELGWRITEMAQEIADAAGDTTVQAAFWWDLTGLTDFPDDAAVGDLGIDMSNGDVWRKTLWAEFFWATSWDLQDRLALKDPRVRLAPLAQQDQRAPPVRQDQRGPKATRETRVRLAPPALRARLAQQDQRARQDPPVRRVTKAIQVLRVLPELRARLVRLVQQDLLARRAPQDQLERQVLLDLPDRSRHIFRPKSSV